MIETAFQSLLMGTVAHDLCGWVDVPGKTGLIKESPRGVQLYGIISGY